jgi:hypothetical protein
VEQVITMYFAAWNSFDLNGLRSCMHGNVRLRDWSIDVAGIDSVLEVNSKTFEQYPEAQIVVCDIATSHNNKAMAQIKIYLGTAELLDVVDVFEFSDGKIQTLTAYKV